MHSGSAFASTQWSLVLAAPDDPAVLDTLLRRYVGPIYAYIRRAGNPRDKAADLTQEFIARVILERGLLDRADPDRGRFRTFLKTALSNFLIDQHRRVNAQSRRADLPDLSGLSLDRFEPSERDDTANAFDRQWAATVMSEALARTEAECRGSDQAQHWEAFSAAILEPNLRHAAPPAHADLVPRLGVSDAAQVSSMVQTVRRKFRRVLLQVVQETLADPSQAQDEVLSLRAFLRV